MTTTTPPIATLPPAKPDSTAAVAKKKLSSPIASFLTVVIAILWTIPTFGLAVSSFRPERAIKTTGWWTFFTDPVLTLDNYRTVLSNDGSAGLGGFFVNSFVIVIPSVIIPIAIATLAAYAFAWIDFPGRNILFVCVFALQIIPIQVTLIPLLSLYVDIGLGGTFWSIWISHTIFALPFAIFLLHNFMKEIPEELVEAARMDGANHARIFFQVLMPLIRPAIAAFAIFQFLWVWNDLLVALVFIGPGDNEPVTVATNSLLSTTGAGWNLVTAGGIISMIVPVIVFLALQRYFIRGLTAGSVKG